MRAPTIYVSTIKYSFDGGNTGAPSLIGEVEVPAGVTSFTVRVASVDDSIIEDTENFHLTATSTDGVINSINSGTGTIEVMISILLSL